MCGCKKWGYRSRIKRSPPGLKAVPKSRGGVKARRDRESAHLARWTGGKAVQRDMLGKRQGGLSMRMLFAPRLWRPRRESRRLLGRGLTVWRALGRVSRCGVDTGSSACTACFAVHGMFRVFCDLLGGGLSAGSSACMACFAGTYGNETGEGRAAVTRCVRERGRRDHHDNQARACAAIASRYDAMLCAIAPAVRWRPCRPGLPNPPGPRPWSRD